MPWPFAVRKAPQVLAEDVPFAATGFALNLFHELAKQEDQANVFFSPASIMLSLWVLREGATGATKAAMTRALGLEAVVPEALQSRLGNLKSALQSKSSNLQLRVANSIWCNPRWAPRPEYVHKAREEYDAEVHDLQSLGPETVSSINRWVSERTNHKIAQIVDALDPLTSLLVLNAIYFKALWAQPFSSAFTRVDSFHAGDGRNLRIPLMTQFGSFPYFEESGFQAVRLRYEDPRLGMYVFLPAKTSSLREFCRKLTAETWERWMRRFATVDGDIRIPRFKLAYGSSLNRVLQKLGMGIAFDPNRAEFDMIQPRPPGAFLSDAHHRSVLEVNEEGTEAAAVTSLMVECVSSPAKPARRFQMVVDRPFLLAICDDQTRTILFLGAVEQPQV